MAVPVVESFTQNDSAGATATTLELTKPANVATGDLLMLIAGSDDGGSLDEWAAEPTWTDLAEQGGSGSAVKLAIFFRIADGTEPATVTLDHPTASELWGNYLRISGADTVTPIDFDTGAADDFTSSAASLDLTGDNSTVDDVLGFYALAFDGGDGVPFSVSGTGFVESAESQSGTGALDASGCWGTKDIGVAGPSGTATVTFNVTDGAAGLQWGVRPAVADEAGTRRQRQIKSLSRSRRRRC